MGDAGLPLGDEAALRAEIARLNKIVTALMDRAEREAGTRVTHFGLFQNAVALENQVKNRTAELETALRENERINRDLQREREEQRALIKKLEEAHDQLLQSDSIGRFPKPTYCAPRRAERRAVPQASPFPPGCLPERSVRDWAIQSLVLVARRGRPSVTTHVW